MALESYAILQLIYYNKQIILKLKKFENLLPYYVSYIRYICLRTNEHFASSARIERITWFANHTHISSDCIIKKYSLQNKCYQYLPTIRIGTTT